MPTSSRPRPRQRQFRRGLRPNPSRLVNTASRKTSLHRDRPNWSLRLASSPILQLRTRRPVLLRAKAHLKPRDDADLDPASRAYPFFTMSRKPPLTRAAKPFPSCVGRSRSPGSGGARRDRTDDLLLAKQALSQLSYGPVSSRPFQATFPIGSATRDWWAWKDLNFRPHAYQARALTN